MHIHLTMCQLPMPSPFGWWGDSVTQYAWRLQRRQERVRMGPSCGLQPMGKQPHAMEWL